MKRLRLPKKRERWAEWKVHKHIEDPMSVQTKEHTIRYRACGSSIAHGRCVYAGGFEQGAPLCDARQKVWMGCPFQATHVLNPHHIEDNAA